MQQSSLEDCSVQRSSCSCCMVGINKERIRISFRLFRHSVDNQMNFCERSKLVQNNFQILFRSLVRQIADEEATSVLEIIIIIIILALVMINRLLFLFLNRLLGLPVIRRCRSYFFGQFWFDIGCRRRTIFSNRFGFFHRLDCFLIIINIIIQHFSMYRLGFKKIKVRNIDLLLVGWLKLFLLNIRSHRIRIRIILDFLFGMFPLWFIILFIIFLSVERHSSILPEWLFGSWLNDLEKCIKLLVFVSNFGLFSIWCISSCGWRAFSTRLGFYAAFFCRILLIRFCYQLGILRLFLLCFLFLFFPLPALTFFRILGPRLLERLIANRLGNLNRQPRRIQVGAMKPLLGCQCMFLIYKSDKAKLPRRSIFRFHHFGVCDIANG
mmetsp:Transcript_5718/g.10252  ORF Transcript_5718/g.10252 Transcript_5718/m.10252 type:complete len:381 (-) Transcript_5718:143-1285(-)